AVVVDLGSRIVAIDATARTPFEERDRNGPDLVLAVDRLGHVADLDDEHRPRAVVHVHKGHRGYRVAGRFDGLKLTQFVLGDVRPREPRGIDLKGPLLLALEAQLVVAGVRQDARGL